MENPLDHHTSSIQTWANQPENPVIKVKTNIRAGAVGVGYKCDLCRNNCKYAEHKYACLSECDLIC